MLSIQSEKMGENLSEFANDTQVNNYVAFGSNETYTVTEKWTKYSISIIEINKNSNLTNATGVLYLKGVDNFDGKNISIKNIYYTQE